MIRKYLPALVLFSALLAPIISEAQSIRTSSPNGGEIWKENEIHEITWSTQETTGDITLYLEITRAGETSHIEYLTTVSSDAGKFTWAVPNLGSEPLQARLIVEGAEVEDASDAFFTILPQGSLNVQSSKKNSDFTLRGFYPNPASDAVTFTWSPAGKNAVIAKLYNSSGVVVRTTSVNLSSSELRLEVSDLPQGSYFYELLTDGNIARGVLTIKR